MNWWHARKEGRGRKIEQNHEKYEQTPFASLNEWNQIILIIELTFHIPKYLNNVNSH